MLRARDGALLEHPDESVGVRVLRVKEGITLILHLHLLYILINWEILHTVRSLLFDVSRRDKRKLGCALDNFAQRIPDFEQAFEFPSD